MTRRSGAVVAVLIVTAGLYVWSRPPPVDPAQRDRLAYEAAVRHVHSTFLHGASTDDIVVHDSAYALPRETVGLPTLPPPFGPDREVFGEIPWLLLWRLYVARTRPLAREAVPFEARLADPASIDSLMSSHEPHVFYWFSPVVYSGNGRHALVYYGMFCGGSCGHGGWIYLRREEQEWKVAHGVQHWVS